MKKVSFIIATIVLFALLGSACGVLGLKIQGNTATLTVTLQQQMINDLLQRTITTQNNNTGNEIFDKITSLDFMEPDTIRVNGTRLQGGSQVSGSADVKFSVVDNALKAEITAVNIPGMDLNSQEIKDANNKLSQAFNESARQSQSGNVKVTSAKIAGQTLQIVTEVTIK